MHKIKVNINKPDPSEAVVRKYKNFDRFVSKYQQFHTPSGIRYLFKHDIKRLVLVVIIILLLLILLLSEEGEASATTTYLQSLLSNYLT